MGSAGRTASAPARPSIGQTLAGKYVLDRVLGEGGMALVFEARHQRLGQRVAIKVLAPELARYPELVTRFEREARSIAQLRTRHVVRVTDVDATADGLPYMVMELLDGCDLDAELAMRGRLPLGEAVDCILQACAAMIDAHEARIIHRDLKPANLFVSRDDRSGARSVKVLDFGISKVVGEASRLTGAGTVIGTVLYMSPEQVRACPDLDARADVWSLGVILFELLAGHPPWEGSSQQIAAAIVSDDAPDIRVYVDVPEGAAATIRSMLQRDVARRISSVREVVLALAPYAPPGSLGAAVAEQVSAASPNARAAAAPAATGLVQRTVPILPRVTPPAYLSTPRSGAVADVPAAADSARLTQHEGAEPRSRALLVALVAMAFIGVVGLVLIALSLQAEPNVPARPDAQEAP